MTQQLGLFDKVKPPSQADRVLRMLEESELGVCAVDFLEAYIPRFSARLKEIRDTGRVIEKRKCFSTSHRHRTRQVRYVLMPKRKHRLSPSE